MSSQPQASTRKRYVLGAHRRAALAALAGLYALFAALGPVGRAPALCPFLIFTKHRCPLCGLTRATRALTKGELSRALALHPLAPLLWAAAIGGLARCDANRLSSRHLT
jgi:hypothetical protein